MKTRTIELIDLNWTHDKPRKQWIAHTPIGYFIIYKGIKYYSASDQFGDIINKFKTLKEAKTYVFDCYSSAISSCISKII